MLYVLRNSSALVPGQRFDLLLVWEQPLLQHSSYNAIPQRGAACTSRSARRRVALDGVRWHQAEVRACQPSAASNCAVDGVTWGIMGMKVTCLPECIDREIAVEFIIHHTGIVISRSPMSRICPVFYTCSTKILKYRTARPLFLPKVIVSKWGNEGPIPHADHVFAILFSRPGKNDEGKENSTDMTTKGVAEHRTYTHTRT